ncbi:MAG: hypothetical protein O3A93_13000 [Chloroflexi bacterium]|nr:hypothetical protein [Chloroflexota bacterium]MDA1272153.1 hypothetical protein [Chloroflexota bacterium]PKB58507.1 MAG: hypothetical protein BZY83_06680 [SAR202 cluster bacterium Casp-Chloro-G2]
MSHASRDPEPNDWSQIIEPSSETAITHAVPEAVVHLRTALAAGAPWRHAIIEAIGRWTMPEETYEGRNYRYLLQGEAFDWLLLAERLCADVDGAIPGAIPSDEKEKFLFNGQIPDTMDEDQFRDYLGPSKYRAYMNFRYGVVLEEALQLTSEEEVRKRHLSRSLPDNEELTEQAFNRLYGKPRSELLEEFQKATRKDRRRNLTLSDLNEFTYWLHKRRINLWDPARVASDTRKAIRRLEQLEQRRNERRRSSQPNAAG